MFSSLLSSDQDFLMPIDTQEPGPTATSQPPMLPSHMSMPGSGPAPQAMSFPQFPMAPTSHQSFPASSVHPAPPPLNTQHGAMGLGLAYTGLIPTPSPSPPSASPWGRHAFPFPFPAPANSQWEKRKRCSDEEVQFVSEKPVKKRRLASISNGTLMNPQQKGLTTQPAQPVQRPQPSRSTQQTQSLASGPREFDVNGGPPPPPPKPTPAFETTQPPAQSGANFLDRDPAISAILAKFSFPQSFPVRTTTRRMSLAPLSPKSLPGMMPPDLLQRGRSGPATITAGGIDERAPVGAIPTLENGTSAVLNVNMLPPPALAADGTRTAGHGNNEAAGPSVPPTGDIDKPQSQPKATIAGMSQAQQDTPVPEGSVWNATDMNNHQRENRPTWEQNQPIREEAVPKPPADQNQGRQEVPGPVAPVVGALQSTNAVTSAQMCDAVVGINEVTVGGSWPQYVPSLAANASNSNSNAVVNAPGDPLQQRETTAFQPACTSSSIAKPTTNQAQTLNAQSHIGGRPQLQLQTRTPSPAQTHHNAAHHSAAPGQAKGPCRICAAKRQQAALQKASTSHHGSISQFSHGPLPHQGVGVAHGAAAHGVAGYNVMFVPTSMQAPAALGGGQFAGSHSIGHAGGGNPGAMAMPSQYQYLLQNQQAQGMIAPAGMAVLNNGQGPMDTSSPMAMNQVAQVPPTSMPRTQAQQQQQQQQTQHLPKKFIHQEPSPGKHIIVDIADTAMEVFPFAKVAKRHGVSADKVRNIFEAVVAVPFLRVPADKRRAAKIGQDRVKKYLVAKKELEKQQQQQQQQQQRQQQTVGGGVGRGGGQQQEQEASVYEIARALGPEDSVPREWAHGYGGPW